MVVGSSSSNMSGCSSNTRHNATLVSRPRTACSRQHHRRQSQRIIAISPLCQDSTDRECMRSARTLRLSIVMAASPSSKLHASHELLSSARCIFPASSTLPAPSVAYRWGPRQLSLSCPSAAHACPEADRRRHDSQQTDLRRVCAKYANFAPGKTQPDIVQNDARDRNHLAQLLHHVNELRSHGRLGKQVGTCCCRRMPKLTTGPPLGDSPYSGGCLPPPPDGLPSAPCWQHGLHGISAH